MFGGIVSELGHVLEVPAPGSGRLLVGHPPGWARLEIGDSVAVNGCCLTAVAVSPGTFATEVMPETMRRTALGSLEVGAPVNLEAALALQGAVGGHLVSGHVDAVGEVRDRWEEGNAVGIRLLAPAEVARYCVPQGSIAVDGCSLTLVSVADQADGSALLEVSLIPHTVKNTVASRYRCGFRVNLEADLIAKLVERLTAPHLIRQVGDRPAEGPRCR